MHLPPSLNQAEVRTLGNHLRTALNPRHHVNPTAFRIAVGVGQRHFPCGAKETPHLLEHLLPGSSLDCPGLKTGDAIIREDLIAAYLRYDVPTNMLVIAVGPFEPEAMLAQVQATLGSMPAHQAPVPAFEEPRWPTAAARVTSRFTPLVDSEAIVEVAWRTDGRRHEDYEALVLLEDYLARAFFDELRTRRGLADAPGASYVAFFGMFSLCTDIDLDQIETAIRVVDALLEPLLSGPLPDDVVHQARANKLLQSAQAFATNRAIVEFDGGDHRLHYIRQPFQREPDFGVTSVDYGFAELLARVGAPS